MTSTTTTGPIVDLHDLVTILLRERLLTESRFKYARLAEVNDGSTPRTFIPQYIPLPVYDNLPSNPPRINYFLNDDTTQRTDTPTEPSTFPHPDLARSSPAPIPYPDLELLFWRIRHYDAGYILAAALQQVLDALPSSTSLLIRTSRGYTLRTSPTDFTIAEAPLKPSNATYVCKITQSPGVRPAQIRMTQYITGTDGKDLPWVYLLFGGPSVARREPNRDGRVAVDLISPLIGLRGLGGEVFILERLADIRDKLLTNPWQPEELVLSGRIVASPPRIQQYNESKDLAERVSKRFEAIQSGEELFCAYCGKTAPAAQCGGCRKSKYCNTQCQSMGWKYHKRWCKEDTDERDLA